MPLAELTPNRVLTWGSGVRSVPLAGVPMGVSGDDIEPPNGNDGSMAQSRTPSRPDPVRWLWYTFGGGLGPRYRDWVLLDVTSRTHLVRQVVRAMVQIAAAGVLAMLILGFAWITWISVIGGLLLSLAYRIAFFDAFAEHRLFQHGYPWGTAQHVMNERQAKDKDQYLPTIPQRSNTGTIGTRPRRLGQRSTPIGKNGHGIHSGTPYDGRLGWSR
jgi:hypothetical protein